MGVQLNTIVKYAKLQSALQRNHLALLHKNLQPRIPIFQDYTTQLDRRYYSVDQHQNEKGQEKLFYLCSF